MGNSWHGPVQSLKITAGKYFYVVKAKCFTANILQIQPLVSRNSEKLKNRSMKTISDVFNQLYVALHPLKYLMTNC